MSEIKNLNIEIKEVSESGVFSGYGSVFGNVDSYGDVVDKGAFTRTLKNRNSPVKLLWQHRGDEPIGVFTEIVQDDKGLSVKGQLNLEVQRGKEAYSLLRQGALDGLSIGYATVKDKIVNGVRFLKEVKLYEISLVTFPANEAAQVNSVKNDFNSLFDTLNEEQKRTVMAELRQMALSEEHTDSDEEGGEVKAVIDAMDDLLNDLADSDFLDYSDLDGLAEEKTDDSPEAHSLDDMLTKIFNEDKNNDDRS